MILNYTTTLMTTLTSTLTSINNTTNQINASINTHSSDSDPDSSLSASYIALIISVIGLFSTVLVHYNIKKIKICCINLECKKTQKDIETFDNNEDEDEFSENYYVVNNHSCNHSSNHSNHSNHSSNHNCNHSHHSSRGSSIIRTIPNKQQLIIETIV
jgi:hypothetical protein